MDVLLRPENSGIKITIRNSPRLLFIYHCPRKEIMKGKQYIDEQVSKLGTAPPINDNNIPTREFIQVLST